MAIGHALPQKSKNVSDIQGCGWEKQSVITSLEAKSTAGSAPLHESFWPQDVFCDRT